MEFLLLLVMILNVLVLLYCFFMVFRKQNERLKSELKKELNNSMDAYQLKLSNDNANMQQQLLVGNDLINSQMQEVTKANYEFQEKMLNMFYERMDNLQKSNDARLQSMELKVQNQLDESLSKRLDDSFKQISTNLQQLYRSLGEINHLSGDIFKLNQSLSNVKNRGIWGEIQLEAIIENTMSTNQYAKNVLIDPQSNYRVEFAIKVPNNDSFVYLPIDSKLPLDTYQKVVDASERLDKTALNEALKLLERVIKQQAKDISDKYIRPPYSLDYGVMFLASESLYCEVIKIDGLMQFVADKYHVLLCGPSTLNALLNSLRVGFTNITLYKKSEEVLKLLQAMKAQYSTLSKLIDKQSQRLYDATQVNESIKHRTNMIQNKMREIEAIDEDIADEYLSIK